MNAAKRKRINKMNKYFKRRIEMEKIKLFSVYVLIGTLFFGRVPVQAQIEVDPTEDFGEVEIGYYASAILSIMNTGWVPYVIKSIEINGDTDFSLMDPFSTCVLHHGEVLDIGVVFSPTAVGAASADFEIDWTNGTCGTTFVALTGIGVSTQPPPVSIEDILSLFDASAANGSLAGDGPGSSAVNRLNALRNMLVEASYLISQGNYESACDQLNAAYIHCDGQDNPKDFIQGTMTATLNHMILGLMVDIGCL